VAIAPPRKTAVRRAAFGWAAVALSTAIASFWAFWGAIENFHEGWYHESLASNLAMCFGQYLAPSILFVGAGVVGAVWPRAGGVVHGLGAAGLAWFFRGAGVVVLLGFLVGPLLLLAAGYAFGRPAPRRRAVLVLVGVPLLTAVASGFGPAVRVAGRLDDGDLGERRVAGNGVDLVWAPAGPGWPSDGVPWEEARRRCRHLTRDGRSLAASPQDIWRLPTVDEAVRSFSRHGRNAEGTWNPAEGTATYARTPDKESPLWDVHSKVIYWWTSTEVDAGRAYIVVYDGKVWPREKSSHWGYLGFRAVRAVDAR
jgi:hypothetical protein